MALQSPRPDVALNLALAVVSSSNAPVLLLDGDLKVVAASRSFCNAFTIDADSVVGLSVFALGAGEWDMPRLRSLLNATVQGHAEIDAYEMDLDRADTTPRSLVLHAQKLHYGDVEQVRLLLTVSDVTDALAAEKLKDDLLRDKGVLLQEVQHRVANSLQIIASVLMQSARRVNSEETRRHLRDAHHRVMSVAAVQQHLAASRIGAVELLPYFEQLCESIGASMIHDHDRLSLDVDADDSVVQADISISLGLVVTELVINALKHAFPDGRQGKIKVDYRAQGRNWTLSVKDDGVGMLKKPDGATAGLGTSIVESLAKQLKARVYVADNHPGTAVSIVHKQVFAVDGAKAGPTAAAV